MLKSIGYRLPLLDSMAVVFVLTPSRILHAS